MGRDYIGKRIAFLRKEKELSQLELAERCGLKQHHISRIESGKYNTGIDLISKIANVLGCRVEIVEKK